MDEKYILYGVERVGRVMLHILRREGTVIAFGDNFVTDGCVGGVPIIKTNAEIIQYKLIADK